MKKIIYLFWIVFILGCQKEGNEKLNASKMKIVTEYLYSTKNISGNIEIDNLKYKNVLFYQENGDIEELHNYDSNENFESKFIYKCDDENRIIENVQYSESGSYLGKCIVTYSDSEKKSESLGYDSNNILITKSIDEYDDNWNMIISYEYSYYQDKNEFFERKETYTYNDKNNVIEIKEFDTDGYLVNTSTYEYTEYDKSNNWTNRIEHYVDDYYDYKFILTREIEYY